MLVGMETDIDQLSAQTQLCDKYSCHNLGQHSYHGMEEVVGSIPIRSANCFKYLALSPFRDFSNIPAKLKAGSKVLACTEI